MSRGVSFASTVASLVALVIVLMVSLLGLPVHLVSFPFHFPTELAVDIDWASPKEPYMDIESTPSRPQRIQSIPLPMCPSPACRARLTKSALHSGYGNAPNGAWYIAAESYGDIIDWENGDTKETGEKS